MSERKGLVTIFGNPLTLTGEPIGPGSKAPAFTALDNELNPKSLADYAGKEQFVPPEVAKRFLAGR